MFKANIVLSEIDLGSNYEQLEAFAKRLGLLGDTAVLTEAESTRTWHSGADKAPLEVMYATVDKQLECTYLELRGMEHEAIVRAVALAYALLPVRMPQELVQEAVDTWHKHPLRLQRAALAATDETAKDLGEAILLALKEEDPETWNAAAGAAALMPRNQGKQIISRAMDSEPSALRRSMLSRFIDLDCLL